MGPHVDVEFVLARNTGEVLSILLDELYATLTPDLGELSEMMTINHVDGTCHNAPFKGWSGIEFIRLPTSDLIFFYFPVRSDAPSSRSSIYFRSSDEFVVVGVSLGGITGVESGLMRLAELSRVTMSKPSFWNTSMIALIGEEVSADLELASLRDICDRFSKEFVGCIFVKEEGENLRGCNGINKQ